MRSFDRLPLLCAVLTLSGCVCFVPVDEPDGSIDAGAPCTTCRDAGVDGGADAGVDAGVDAGTDAGLPASDGGCARATQCASGPQPTTTWCGASPPDAGFSCVEHLIRRRRMTRRFDSTPLAPRLVIELLDLARRAPSAGYSQGVHFVALSGDSLSRFWKTTGADEWFASVQDATVDGVLNAPVVVLPLADPLAYTSRYAEDDKAGHGLERQENWDVPFWLTDAAMATQNLLLLAQERGLGALYFGIFRNARLALDELGVPPRVLQVGAVALGHRAAQDEVSGSARTRARRSTVDVVHVDRW